MLFCENGEIIEKLNLKHLKFLVVKKMYNYEVCVTFG